MYNCFADHFYSSRLTLLYSTIKHNANVETNKSLLFCCRSVDGGCKWVHCTH